MSNWNKNHTMRSNLSKFDLQKKVTKDTPMHERFNKAFENGHVIDFQGAEYYVVDKAPVKGTFIDNFFLMEVNADDSI